MPRDKRLEEMYLQELCSADFSYDRVCEQDICLKCTAKREDMVVYVQDGNPIHRFIPLWGNNYRPDKVCDACGGWLYDKP